jgi:carboxymethylenebutenolidase
MKSPIKPATPPPGQSPYANPVALPTVMLAAADGFRLPACEVKPQGKPRAGLVMLHEAFGVTEHIKRMAEGYAAEGYHVLAPEMLARAEPDWKKRQLSYNKAGLEQGRVLISGIPQEAWLTDLGACVGYLAGLGLPVAALGYCWGGSLAYMAASKVPGVKAAVCYYGGMMAELAETMQPRCPVMVHLAEHDRYIPVKGAEAALRRHVPEAGVFVYDADHGFNRDVGVSYNETAAKLARERSIAFLAKHLA